MLTQSNNYKIIVKKQDYSLQKSIIKSKFNK